MWQSVIALPDPKVVHALPEVDEEAVFYATQRPSRLVMEGDKKRKADSSEYRLRPGGEDLRRTRYLLGGPPQGYQSRDQVIGVTLCNSSLGT